MSAAKPKSRRWLGWFAVGVLVALGLSGANCLGYLVRAGCGQAEILWKRRPIQEVLREAGLSRETRAGLEHVLAVQRFAAERLRLTPGNSYTYYSDIGRDAAAYNVSAAPELSLVPHTWWFPIVGTVPYLGFFSRQEAEAKAAELRRQGLETSVQSVTAYSTLGYFSDPLLSPQLRLSRFSLTRLVIHETAHATLWFPGDVRFNESFASFVEEEGALAFYRDLHGEGSPLYAKHLEIISEGERIANIFRRYTKRLSLAYRADTSKEIKRAQKARILAELRSELEANASSYKHYDMRKIAARRYNNAHLLSYLRYESGREYFRAEFRAVGSNWRAFLGKMATLRNLTASQRAELLARDQPLLQ